MLIAKFLFTVFLADFVSGLVHWLEDAYARPGMPLIGKIAEENLRHHEQPRDFLKKSWWQSSSDLVLAGLVMMLVSVLTQTFSLWLLLFVVLTINANQIHKWAHQGPRENPRLVTWLQEHHVLQSAREHAKHHRGEKNSHYCVITPYLNFWLEKMGLWKGLESAIEVLIGIKRRRDSTPHSPRLSRS